MQQSYNEYLQSEPSNTKTVTKVCPPPQSLGCTISDLTNVSLTWAEPEPGSTGTFSGYRILRNDVLIGILGTDALSFTDSSAPFGYLHTYEVVASYYAPPGFSSASATASLMIPTTIFANTTYTGLDFPLHNLCTINGATLTLNDLTITPNNSSTQNANFGFVIQNGGNLVLNNCTVNMGNGKISAISGNIILDSSILSSTNGEVNITNSAKLQLMGGSSLVAEGGTVNVDNSDVVLNEESQIFINAQGQLQVANASKIIGHVQEDMIKVNNGLIVLADDTIIESDISSTTRWTGIKIVNSSMENIIKGSFSGTQKLEVNNSTVLISNATFTDCGGIYIKNSSTVQITNVEYSGNLMGIFVDNSKIIADSLNVENNGFREDATPGVAFIYSPEESIIKNSNISGNGGNGVNVNNSRLILRDVNISSNNQHGLDALNNGGVKIDRWSEITDNGLEYNTTDIKYSEIYAYSYCFPRFTYTPLSMYEGVPTFATNKVGGVNFIDNYLLNCPNQLTNQPTNIIPINAIIDTSDSLRYKPGISDFHFGPVIPTVVHSIYNTALEYADNGEYEDAFLLMKDIIKNYPDTGYAQSAINLLPYYNHDKGGSYNDLIQYLEEIEDEDLIFPSQNSQALSMLFSGNYYDAILLYDYLISISNGYIEMLIAELNQAYCYLKLSESGTKQTNELSRRKPTTTDEFVNIYNEIMALINNNENKEDKEIHVPIGNKLSAQNYPNPFNPETTIKFGIREAEFGTLEIFNIKGQKVKTLVNGILEAGEHTVVWNGTDDTGQKVGSGVYLYRLNIGDKSLTQKILMLK